MLVDFSVPPLIAPRTTEQSIAHFEVSLERAGEPGYYRNMPCR